MSAWGKGGLAKSCNALLCRVEENDPTLVDLVILPSKTFGAAELDRIAVAVENGSNTNLKSLSASGHQVPHSSLSNLGSAIASQKSNLTSLAVGDRSVGDEGIIALCSTLEASCGGSLEVLDLEWKGISVNAVAALGRCFGASPRLRQLNLSRNEGVGDDGMVQFCKNAVERAAQEQVAPFPQLESLNLSECGIGKIGTDALVQCLGPTKNASSASNNEGNASLELNLNSNPLGRAGCQSLASLLSLNPVLLVTLSLSKCDIGNEGIEFLRDAVMTTPCSGLRRLNISHNGMDKDGAKVLAESLWSQGKTGWPSLCDLCIAGNNLGMQGVTTLSGSLLQTKSDSADGNGIIETLDLSETGCGAVGAAAALQCRNLSTLRLFNNKLGSEGFHKLCPVLQKGHPVLENLDLGGNNAAEVAVVELLQAVTTYSKLRVLELGGNQGGNDVEEAIQELHRVQPDLDVARDRPNGRKQQ